MHCFNHTEKEAIGICKTCQRGLCPDCATDLGHGLACAGKHEKDVNTIKTLIDLNVKISESTTQTWKAYLLFVALGSVLIHEGLLSEHNFTNVFLGFGICFVAFGVYGYFYNKKLYARKD